MDLTFVAKMVGPSIKIIKLMENTATKYKRVKRKINPFKIIIYYKIKDISIL